jgi:sugar transferase (PEP-CTERM/EpsH1 system associated)
MKLLVMSSRVPWPLDKGDKLRMYHQIRCLSEDNEVYLIAVSDKKDNSVAHKELGKYCKQVHLLYNSRLSIAKGLASSLFGSNPLQIGYFYNKEIAQKVNSLVKEIKPNHIYGQLIRVAEYLKHFDKPKTLDLQDAFSAGLKRRLDKSSGIYKQILKMEYRRVLEYETNSIDSFDFLTIITQADKELLDSKIQTRVSIVPNGVDTDFFKPIVAEKKYDLVFTGNMSYPPNVDAAMFLVKKIMPLVWKEKPNVKVLIAGSSPSIKVKDLETDNVKISGWMDDIRDAYSQSKVFIAPMQIGTGLQNKLLEAMAMKIPSITSDLANMALKAEDGKEILVSNKKNPQMFADSIMRLLSDEKLRNDIVNNAYAFVVRKYNWQASVDILNRLWKS